MAGTADHDRATVSAALRKLDADGRLLADAAQRWSCLWSPRLDACVLALPEVTSQRDAIDACRQLNLFGRCDWQLARIDQLQWLVQRHRQQAMHDPLLFDGRSPDWCWSATPSAWSPLLGWGLQPDSGELAPRPGDRPGVPLALLHGIRPPGSEHIAPALPLSQPSLLPLDAHGHRCTTDAPAAALYLPEFGLMFSAAAIGSAGPQPLAEAHCTQSRLCGWDDWQLASAEQLQLLIDRRRARPASIGLPLRVAGDWYWTRQPPGWQQALVGWIVDFDDGHIGYRERDYAALALAVRYGTPRE